MKSHALFASALSLAVLAAACDDKKPTADPAPSATATTATTAASAPSPAPASATASASAAPSASASATASASAAPSSSASAVAAAPSASAAAAPTCGKKPLPDCPLQGWMKQNTSAAMVNKDFDALVKALDATASLAPPGYPNWVSISRDGAKAARDQNLDGVKASCKGCHNQYKERYIKELRTRKI